MPTPLKKRKADGSQYFRPPAIEAQIASLESISATKRGELFESSARDSSSYVPSEVIVYFMRAAWKAKEQAEFENLFRILSRRIYSVQMHRIGNMDRAEDISEDVVAQFAVLVASDCGPRPGRIDFLESRFDKAMAALRTQSLRKIGPQTVAIDSTGALDNGSPVEELLDEQYVSEFLAKSSSDLDDPAFRSKLNAAINGLPTDQKRVIHLILKGFQIDSKDEAQMTIARILDCDERTVRNRRDRALKTLREVFRPENEQ